MERIVNVADRHGHDQRYAIDPARAMAELGWASTTMFKDGIVLTIDWYMSEAGKKWTEECTSGEYLNWIEKNYKERAQGILLMPEKLLTPRCFIFPKTMFLMDKVLSLGSRTARTISH